jgi:hypothetical protein
MNVTPHTLHKLPSGVVQFGGSGGCCRRRLWWRHGGVVVWLGAIVEILVVQHADIIISHARAHRKIFSKSNPPSSFLLPPVTDPH